MSLTTLINNRIHGAHHMEGAYPEGVETDARGNRVEDRSVVLGDPNYVQKKADSGQMRSASAKNTSLADELEAGLATETDPDKIAATKARVGSLRTIAARQASDAALYDGMGKVIVAFGLFIAACVVGVALDETVL